MSRARTHRIGLFAPPPGAVAAAPFKEDEFDSLAGQLIYALSENATPGGFSVVAINGVVHRRDTDYTLVGAVLTLTVGFPIVVGDCVLASYEFTP